MMVKGGRYNVLFCMYFEVTKCLTNFYTAYVKGLSIKISYTLVACIFGNTIAANLLT